MKTLTFRDYADDEVEFEQHYDGHVWVTVNTGPGVQLTPPMVATLVEALATKPEASTGTPTSISPDDDRSWNEVTIQAAIDEGLAISFHYQKPGGTVEERNMEPEGLTTEEDLFVGYDIDRNDTRAFRLDRVRGRVVAQA